jgi:glyoxylase-like metal-dependent hydrolase (beta-lactamase superfamily II)
VPGASVSTKSADALAAFVRERGLRVRWILETHAHADHLSAGAYLRDLFGAQMVIGRGICAVQKRFKELFGLDDAFPTDGRQFDRLVDDGDGLPLGAVDIRVLATPGHTDDSVTYVIADAAFIGDTMFAPDGGSARCDFPGGMRPGSSLRRSSASSRCRPTRGCTCATTIRRRAARQPPRRVSSRVASGNAHVKTGVTEAEFIAMRETRDAKLSPPRLILPAVQVNIRGGRLPEPDAMASLPASAPQPARKRVVKRLEAHSSCGVLIGRPATLLLWAQRPHRAASARGLGRAW